MSLRWEDERYIRFYTRNLPEWRALSWRARGLFGLIMREVDRAGILKLGKLGAKAVAISVDAPWIEVKDPLSELIADGCIRMSKDGSVLCIPNFIEAQEAPQSDAARKRASRERARSNVTNCDNVESRFVTKTPVLVTSCHVESHGVTSSHSVPSDPCLSVPSFPSLLEETIVRSAAPSGRKLVFDIAPLYEAFPRKEGKVRGLSKLSASIRTPEQYERFRRAVANYAEKVRVEQIERQYVLLFSTFANGRWEDYVDYVAKKPKPNSHVGHSDPGAEDRGPIGDRTEEMRQLLASQQERK